VGLKSLIVKFDTVIERAGKPYKRAGKPRPYRLCDLLAVSHKECIPLYSF